jgi:phage terminase small subunit
LKKKLNIKEKKLVKERISGKTQLQAYGDAGYSVKNKEAAQVNASVKFNKPHIQKAIDDALALHGATPEWAVGQLMKVAEQDKEVGAKRLASKDILELHGWNKADRPTVQIQIKDAFFSEGREVIDVETGHDESTA